MQFVGFLLDCEYVNYVNLSTKVLVKAYDLHALESLVFIILSDGKLVNKIEYFLHVFLDSSNLLIYF